MEAKDQYIVKVAKREILIVSNSFCLDCIKIVYKSSVWFENFILLNFQKTKNRRGKIFLRHSNTLKRKKKWTNKKDVAWDCRKKRSLFVQYKFSKQWTEWSVFILNHPVQCVYFLFQQLTDKISWGVIICKIVFVFKKNVVLSENIKVIFISFVCKEEACLFACLWRKIHFTKKIMRIKMRYEQRKLPSNS